MYPLDRFIGKYMPEHPVIIEAGSHCGDDTLYMNSLWPKAKIYTFEPNPRWTDTIQMKIAPHQNIQFFPLALGDAAGSIDFFQYLADDSGADSTRKPLLEEDFWKNAKVPPQYSPPFQVPVTTLDLWAKDHSVDRVDFMWLDMEGSEGKMLEGSEEILKNTRIIQLEWSEKAVYEGEKPFHELHNFLTDRGFVCAGVSKNQANEVRGDALFFKVAS